MSTILFSLLISQAFASGPGLPACVDLDSQHLTEAVTKAQELASSCLVAKGLNPEIGRKLTEDAWKGTTFHCAYKIDAQAVTKLEKHGADVSVDMEQERPDKATSVPEMRLIDSTVFHELLHVADPDHKRVFSAYSHNHALGFPDGIYGCEFACMGAVESDSRGRAYMFVFERLVRPIPEDASYACPQGAGADCSYLKKYAWLCRNGPPELSGDEEEDGLRLFEDALCVKENEFSLYLKDPPPAAQEIAEAAKEARMASAGLNDDQGRAMYLGGVMRAVLHVSREGSLFDRVWLARFLSDHDCPSAP